MSIVEKFAQVARRAKDLYFANLVVGEPMPQETTRRWFMKDAAFDERIRGEFGEDIRTAIAGGWHQANLWLLCYVLYARVCVCAIVHVYVCT